jgi:hypothetical protein
MIIIQISGVNFSHHFLFHSLIQIVENATDLYQTYGTISDHCWLFLQQLFTSDVLSLFNKLCPYDLQDSMTGIFQ